MSNESLMYIETDKFQNIINKLKEEKTNMETYFNSIKNDGKQMINYWAGDTGKNAYERPNHYNRPHKHHDNEHGNIKKK